MAIPIISNIEGAIGGAIGVAAAGRGSLEVNGKRVPLNPAEPTDEGRGNGSEQRQNER